MVVVGHSPSFRDASAPSARSVPYAIAEFFLADALPRIAVMLFFAVSGFLFFVGNDGTASQQARKIKSRVRSLLVPYLVWSAIAIVIYYVLQALPLTAGWFTNSSRRVVGRSVVDLVMIWLFDPIAYQLWFLRDLFLVVLLTPLMGWSLRRATVPTLVLVGLLHALDVSVPSPVGSARLMTSDGYFYFTVGAAFAIRRWRLDASPAVAAGLTFATLALAVTRAWAHATDRGVDLILFKCVHLPGVPAIWLGYDRWLRWMERPGAKRVSAHAFFVFVAHEPFMTMLRKPIVRFLGAGDLRHAAELILTLTSTVVILVPVAAWIAAKAPSLYSFLCGGRTVSEAAPRVRAT